MNKKFVALAIVALIALSGCTTPANSGENSGEWYITTLNDPSTGEKVRCAINGGSSRSGITCDWSTPTEKPSNHVELDKSGIWKPMLNGDK